MSTHKYEVGDLVQLKSGGPVMTVTGILPDGERVHCKWFAGAKVETDTFATATLNTAQAKRPPNRKAE
jgi:uncharacterized protein YodC (DUF2158 family)